VYRVLVEVGAAGCEVFSVADAMVGEAALPDGKLGGESVGEAALDEAHDSFEADVLRSQNQMHMLGHDDEGVQLVVALASVVLECFYEEFGVDGKLEEAATVVGRRSNKECSGAGSAGGDRHAAIVRRVPQGLKP